MNSFHLKAAVMTSNNFKTSKLSFKKPLKKGLEETHLFD